MEALKELKKLALEYRKQLHPAMPDEYRYVPTYSDLKTNNLTRAVMDFLKFMGHFVERTGVTGRYIGNSKVVKDCLNRTYRIGSGKWVPTSGTKGSSDLKALIRDAKGITHSVFIEIKCAATHDRLSKCQKKYKEEVEAHGATYLVVTNFQSFYEWYFENF